MLLTIIISVLISAVVSWLILTLNGRHLSKHADAFTNHILSLIDLKIKLNNLNNDQRHEK